MSAFSRWRKHWVALRVEAQPRRGGQPLNVERLEDRSVFAGDTVVDSGVVPEGPTGESPSVLAADADDPPAVTISGDASGDEGQPLTFSGESPVAQPDDVFTWVYIDADGEHVILSGVIDETGEIPDAVFTPPDSGTYDVELRIESPLGDAKGTATASVTIDNVAPDVTVTAALDDPQEGDELEFNGSFTDPADAADGPYSYTWELLQDGVVIPAATVADTAAGNGAVASYQVTPPASGSYQVRLTVTDADGDSSEATYDFEVADVAPTVEIDVVGSGVRDEEVVVSGRFTDPAGDADGPYTYTWQVTGPDDFDEDPATVAGPSAALNDFSFTPTKPGAYQVTLTVTDANGVSSDATFEYVVANGAPTVVIDGPAGPVNEGEEVTFEGVFDDDGPDGPYTYTWRALDSEGNVIKSESDEQAAPGDVPTFTFTPPTQGTYTVELIVEDALHASTTDSANLVALDASPQPSIDAPAGGDEGSPVTVNGAINGPAGSYEYWWTVTRPDGSTYSTTPVASGAGALPSYTFTPDDDGAYSVTLTVRNTVTDEEVEASDTVAVANVAPDVTIAPLLPGAQGVPYIATGSFTDPGSASESYTYKWTVTYPNGDTQDFGSGSVELLGVPPLAGFIPLAPGTYTVTLTINDGTEDGSAPATFSINNADPAPVIDGPLSGPEGSSVTVGGSFTDPGLLSDGPYHYTWTVTYPDGTIVTHDGNVDSPSDEIDGVTFTPPVDGDYTITLTVTDDSGGEGTITATFTATNVAPIVTVDDPPPATQGTSVTVTGSFTDPGSSGGETYSYQWRISGPGGSYTIPGGSPATPGSPLSVTFTPVGAGEYTVTLEVFDGESTGSDSVDVVVANLPPDASITGPSAGPEGAGATFNGSFTDVGGALDGDYTYTWAVYDSHGNPVDGASATGTMTSPGAVPSFTFTAPDNGVYTIRLTVTDVHGGSDTVELVFTAGNVAPEVTVVGPDASVPQGADVSINGSFADPAGPADATYNYVWTIVDPHGNSRTVTGTASDDGAIPNLIIDATMVGTYTVTLTVTDKDGASDSATLTFTVENIAPTVDVSGPATGPEGTAVTFSGSFSDPGGNDGGPYHYQWFVRDSDGNIVADGNGTTTDSSTVPDISFTPGDNGVYTIELIITDGEGLATSDTFTFTATNVAPDVTVDPQAPVDQGQPVSIGGSFTDPAGANDAAYSYTWTITYPDGSTQTVGPASGAMGDVAALNFTPLRPGTYTITLTVTDNDGGVGSESITFDVRNLPPVPHLSGPTTADEGSTITYQGSFTDAGGVDARGYTVTWTVYNSDHVPVDSTTYTITNPSAGFPNFNFQLDNGTYTVELSVTDPDGGIATVTSELIVANVAPTPSLDLPTGAEQGTEFQIGGSFTDPGGAVGEHYTYTWRVYDPNGNELPAAGGNASAPGSVDPYRFTPTVSGVYRVVLTVSDGTESTTIEGTFTVANKAPTVVINPQGPGDEGTEVTFDGSFSDPGGAGDGDYTYTWIVTDQNNQEIARITRTAGSPAEALDGVTFLPLNDGTYKVRLEVTDKLGGFGFDEFLYVVENVAPVATITSPDDVPEGSVVDLVGHFTDPGADGRWTYTWTVNKLDADGNVVSTQTFTGRVDSPGEVRGASFAVDDDGRYQILLTITEANGTVVSNVAEQFLTVFNVLPEITVDGDFTVNEGSTAHFTASFTDPGRDGDWTYTWTVYRNGEKYAELSGTATSPGAISPFSFFVDDNRNHFHVVLTVHEADPLLFGASEFDLTILDVPPAPTIGGPATANEGASLTYTGRFTDPGQDGPYTYQWILRRNGEIIDDSVTGTASPSFTVPNYTFSPDDEGEYSLELIIHDSFDGVGSTTFEIDVANVAPTVGGYFFLDAVTRERVTFINEGQRVILVGTITDPGRVDAFTVTVVARGGGAARTFEHLVQPVGGGPVTFELEAFFLFPGVYTIVTTADDRDGGVTRAVDTIVVSDRPGFSVTIDPPPPPVLPLLPPVVAAVPPRVDQSIVVNTSTYQLIYGGSGGSQSPVFDDANADIRITATLDLLSGFHGRELGESDVWVLFGTQGGQLIVNLMAKKAGIYRLRLQAGNAWREFEIPIGSSGLDDRTIVRVSNYWNEVCRGDSLEHFNINFFHTAREYAPAAPLARGDGDAQSVRDDGTSEDESTANGSAAGEAARAAPVSPRDMTNERPDDEPSGWRVGLDLAPAVAPVPAAPTGPETPTGSGVQN